MTDFHKILVPIDFSEHAQQALDDAIDLARRFGAELHLLHCYSITPAMVSPYGIAIPENLDRDVRIAARRRLAEWGDKARAAGCNVVEEVIAGFPAEQIVAQAEKLGIDLVVIGTRGLSGLKHVLLGSVAERTIRTARCPVLTVKRAGSE